MILPDVNLIVYATNASAAHHESARFWWESTLNGDEPVGLAWVVVLAFLRLTTSARVVPNPLSPEQATGVVDSWLEQPVVQAVVPSERHWGILRELIGTTGTAANLTTDAHLAALALDYGATLCSADADFGRFPGVHWRNPLA